MTYISMHLQNSNLFDSHQKLTKPPPLGKAQHNEEDIFHNCGDFVVVVLVKDVINIFYKNSKINSINGQINESVKRFQLAIAVHMNAHYKPQPSQTSHATLFHNHLQLHAFLSMLQLCTCTLHMQDIKKKFYMYSC